MRTYLNVSIVEEGGTANALAEMQTMCECMCVGVWVGIYIYIIYILIGQHLEPGARCSSVVRAFAHGALGCRIDPSWGWTH